MIEKATSDKPARIGEILDVMRNTWDLPADCNEGELFAYAETLYDRIVGGTARTRFTRISLASRPTISKCRPPTPSGRSRAGRRLAQVTRLPAALSWAPGYGRNPEAYSAPFLALETLQ